MKNQMILLLLFFLLTPLFPGTVHAAEGEKTYVLSYSSGSKFHALVRERTKAVYDRAGLKVKFVSLPHNRSLLSANDGSVDGDVGRVPSVEEKYPNILRVNAKLMELSGAVYTLNPDIKTYDESILSKYRVGYVLGVRWAQKKMVGHPAVTVGDYDALFEMLLQGRVDLVLATVVSTDEILDRLGERAKQVRKLQPFVFTAPIYHYVNKNNVDIVPLLEKAANEINQEWVLTFYTGIETPLFEILQRRLQEAMRRIGRVCEVKGLGSSQRALVMANERGDGDLARAPDIKQLVPGETDNLLQVPESITEYSFNAYALRDFAITGWKSLENKRSGFRVGLKVLEKNVPGDPLMLPDTMRLFNMLADKRLDAVVENKDIADYLIKKNRLTGIRRLDPSLTSFPSYTYLHVKHRNLVQSIARSLAEMKVDGTFDRIRSEVFAELMTDSQGPR